MTGGPEPRQGPRRGRVLVRAGVAALLVAAVAVVADLRLQDEERAARDDVEARYPDVRGTWEALRYDLAGGERWVVDGRLVFGEREWQVLYFVLDEGGAARRGSAEGGTYTLRGDTVVFRHHRLLQAGDSLPGLGATPVRIEVTGEGSAPREPTRVEIRGDTLTLAFPSGNRMTFRRAAGEPGAR